MPLTFENLKKKTNKQKQKKSNNRQGKKKQEVLVTIFKKNKSTKDQHTNVLKKINFKILGFQSEKERCWAWCPESI